MNLRNNTIRLSILAILAVLVLLIVGLISDTRNTYEGRLRWYMLTASPSPEDVLQRFYVYEGAEDQLMDPLILAGDKVVPLVIEKVKDKNMPRRRYAIAFLGNGSYRQGLPVLQQILQDNTEEVYYRGDALLSIYQIDIQLSRDYAQKYQNEPENLGRIAKGILASDTSLNERRSYWDAWAGRHD